MEATIIVWVRTASAWTFWSLSLPRSRTLTRCVASRGGGVVAGEATGAPGRGGARWPNRASIGGREAVTHTIRKAAISAPRGSQRGRSHALAPPGPSSALPPDLTLPPLGETAPP